MAIINQITSWRISYETPELHVIKLETEGIICTSDTITEDLEEILGEW